MNDSLKSTRPSWVATLALAAVMTTTTALAADPDDARSSPLKYEITPFAGYRFGGRFDLTDTTTRIDAAKHLSYGLSLDVNTDQSTQYELFYSRQSTHLTSPSFADTTIEYLHLGGTVLFGETRRFQPYVVGTVGATRFSPDSPVGRDSLYFSLSLGAGLRVPFNEHLALRLEARGFATFSNTNGALFCRSDQTGGVCALHGSGSTFIQGDVLAGLAITF